MAVCPYRARNTHADREKNPRFGKQIDSEKMIRLLGLLTVIIFSFADIVQSQWFDDHLVGDESAMITNADLLPLRSGQSVNLTFQLNGDTDLRNFESRPAFVKLVPHIRTGQFAFLNAVARQFAATNRQFHDRVNLYLYGSCDIDQTETIRSRFSCFGAGAGSRGPNASAKRYRLQSKYERELTSQLKRASLTLPPNGIQLTSTGASPNFNPFFSRSRSDLQLAQLDLSCSMQSPGSTKSCLVNVDAVKIPRVLPGAFFYLDSRPYLMAQDGNKNDIVLGKGIQAFSSISGNANAIDNLLSGNYEKEGFLLNTYGLEIQESRKDKIVELLLNLPYMEALHVDDVDVTGSFHRFTGTSQLTSRSAHKHHESKVDSWLVTIPLSNYYMAFNFTAVSNTRDDYFTISGTLELVLKKSLKPAWKYHILNFENSSPILPIWMNFRNADVSASIQSGNQLRLVFANRNHKSVNMDSLISGQGLAAVDKIMNNMMQFYNTSHMAVSKTGDQLNIDVQRHIYNGVVMIHSVSHKQKYELEIDNKYLSSGCHKVDSLTKFFDNTEMIAYQISKCDGSLDQGGTEPVYEFYENRLTFNYQTNMTTNMLTTLSEVFASHGIQVTRRQINQANGYTTMKFTFVSTSIDEVKQIAQDASLRYCLPNPSISNSDLSVGESVYASVGALFVEHFIDRLGYEYVQLANEAGLNPQALSKIKRRLKYETYHSKYIVDVLESYPRLIKLLYKQFLGNTPIDHDLKKLIEDETANEMEKRVFDSLLSFNSHLLDSNFFTTSKNALSFKLDPAFLNKFEYPMHGHTLFFVVGADFRGFHLRFRDVARGGIRMVKSRTADSFDSNSRGLFDEVYALGSTQQKKNKDIPEGGSKGAILLNWNSQEKADIAFQKYVDAILDIVLAKRNADKGEEILFFGPDEGTANYMDWAALHARKRGASFWKAFTTGKSQSLGGIPHDVFGMTTRSVHQYVLGILRKLGIDERVVTKVQTGGPDGDLGSNEIKISKDKTTAIVDGSGVLYDPSGLDRHELRRIATHRLMISHFNASKLGPEGFRKLVEETGGMKFRNEFHLNPLASADLFVPCGGRPNSVDVGNVDRLPDFKWIVEGANVFFSQEARIKLEERGTIIFRDASTNKGGVTSSSLEVLAALALSDAEFEKYMQTQGEFYNEYVTQVQKIIDKNARLEFETLWAKHQLDGRAISLLSDELSLRIIQLDEHIQRSDLWKDGPFRKRILKLAIPPLLGEKIGMNVLMNRIPVNYQKAIFGSFVASRLVYYDKDTKQFSEDDIKSFFGASLP